jgi:hypothetical protein
MKPPREKVHTATTTALNIFKEKAHLAARLRVERKLVLRLAGRDLVDAEPLHSRLNVKKERWERAGGEAPLACERITGKM